jgi:hypothetical protein
VADKTASLVFFYFGEGSYVNALAQETVPLWMALEGYDHAVLLSHEVDFGNFNLSDKAEDLADVRDVPTKENLARELNRLRDEGYVVDLFIFSHGWKDMFRTSKGTYGENTTVNQRWLEANVTEPLKLRMVWQCNCYGSTLNDFWASIGAKAAAGSRFVNFYPTRFRKFMKEWRAGSRFGASLYRSDTKASHTPVQAYITVDAAARLKEWDGNLLQAARVLGNNDHSRRYFRKCWNGDDVPDDKTGKQVMNESSKMLVTGNRKITRNSKLRW